MEGYLNTPGNTSWQGKKFEAQARLVFAAFKKKPCTMLMASFETGIFRANICRFIAEWEKEGLIQIIRKDTCPISRHRAGYYTTDSSLFNKERGRKW